MGSLYCGFFFLNAYCSNQTFKDDKTLRIAQLILIKMFKVIFFINTIILIIDKLTVLIVELNYLKMYNRHVLYTLLFRNNVIHHDQLEHNS